MLWKQFNKKKPKKNGWYQCTIEIPGLERRVIDLHWYNNIQGFIDTRRQDVFSTYEVYDFNDDTKEFDKYTITDKSCDLTNYVIAWRKLPRPYMKIINKGQ